MAELTTLEEKLVDWALPIQECHLQEARQGSLTLADEEDPSP